MKGGKILYDKNRNSICDTMARTKGGIDPVFKEKYNLSPTSKSHEYVDVFLPLNKPQRGLFLHEPNCRKFEGNLKIVCKWTKTKADYIGAGPKGSYYLEFVLLTH